MRLKRDDTGQWSFVKHKDSLTDAFSVHSSEENQIIQHFAEIVTCLSFIDCRRGREITTELNCNGSTVITTFDSFIQFCLFETNEWMPIKSISFRFFWSLIGLVSTASMSCFLFVEWWLHFVSASFVGTMAMMPLLEKNSNINEFVMLRCNYDTPTEIINS